MNTFGTGNTTCLTWSTLRHANRLVMCAAVELYRVQYGAAKKKRYIKKNETQY